MYQFLIRLSPKTSHKSKRRCKKGNGSHQLSQSRPRGNQPPINHRISLTHQSRGGVVLSAEAKRATLGVDELLAINSRPWWTSCALRGTNCSTSSTFVCLLNPLKGYRHGCLLKFSYLKCKKTKATEGKILQIQDGHMSWTGQSYPRLAQCETATPSRREWR